MFKNAATYLSPVLFVLGLFLGTATILATLVLTCAGFITDAGTMFSAMAAGMAGLLVSSFGSYLDC